MVKFGDPWAVELEVKVKQIINFNCIFYGPN